jgi:hypothetical protein
MSIPKSYMTSTKNVEAILHAIQAAKAPERFNATFLEALGFKSSSDRLFIPVLKSLGFITADGAPTDVYYAYLDQTRAGHVLAKAIQEGYADLFQVNRKAHEMSRIDVQNKLKTLTQGRMSDVVLEDMAYTFKKLCSLADWSELQKEGAEKPKEAPPPLESKPPSHELEEHPVLKLEHLAYNIQIILPESRDPAVYDALFKSLKEHLLK